MSQCVGRVPRLKATGEPEGLNMVESELSVLARQCLNRRIANVETLEKEVSIWEGDRNSNKVCVDWRFCTEDARVKLYNLSYPSKRLEMNY